MAESTPVPLQTIGAPPRRRRTRSATRFSKAWTQSWQGIQQGDRLQADAITEAQIEMIALGGVIGTGLFLGTATALRHSGPAGAFIGYIITGSVVLSVTKSLAHIVSCFPRSGGPVGLSHLYVDPALAFALGWNAWYNWTIILPAEVAAAGLLMNTFLPKNAEGTHLQLSANMGWTTFFIIAALGVNFIGARNYGKVEAVFSGLKILTIVSVLVSGIVLDLIKTSDGRLGFRYWKNPGAFNSYRSAGALGRFFGLWAVLLQACFSYFGTEVAAMAAAEVRNPRISIPNAARNAWIRISVFYVGAVLVAGLLVPHDDPRLGATSLNKGEVAFTSPFVIAFQSRNFLAGGFVMAALFVFSAFSAAVSDVFISSRLFFFMSKCGHAPRWGSYTWKLQFGVVPYGGVLLAGAFALLAFLTAANAEQAFHWLSTMTSTASLCSWIGMMHTYIVWQRGLERARNRAKSGDQFYQEFFERYKARIPDFRWYRVARAWYAFVMCILILVFNGWAVFTVPGAWIVARTPDDVSPKVDPDIGEPVPTFITSYLPVPMFLLLIFGYKLISRTQSVSTEDMVLNMALEWEAAEAEPLPAGDRPSRSRRPIAHALNPVAMGKFVAWSLFGFVADNDAPAVQQ